MSSCPVALVGFVVSYLISNCTVKHHKMHHVMYSSVLHSGYAVTGEADLTRFSSV